jgi:PAS domain S-box-containing protein
VAKPETRDMFSPRMVDSLVDAVVVIDAAGAVLYANPAVERLLGWQVGSLFGEPFATLVPEWHRHAVGPFSEALIESDAVAPSQGPVRTAAIGADGSEIPVDIAFSLVDEHGGLPLLIAVIWDASNRIDIERYQRVSEDLLAFLAGASGTGEEIVPQLLAILCSALDFEFATAWRWDPASELLQCEHAWPGDTPEFEALFRASIGTTIHSGEGLPGLVVGSDEPIWHSELAKAQTLKRYDAILAGSFQTGFCFPIRTRERLVGVIELLTRALRKPDQPLFDAVADVGAKLGEFIERLELESERNELLAELARSHRRHDFLLKANRALAGANGLEDTVRKLAEVALPTLGDICLIDVLDADGELDRMAARHADPALQTLTDELGKHSPDLAGDHPAALAVRKGESQWSRDMDEDFLKQTTQGVDHYQLTQVLEFESYVSVPLLTDDKAIGALTLVTAGSGRTIRNEELVLAEELAAQVATVINRARVFDEQSTIARLLQSSLLPQSIDRCPDIAVAVRYVPGARGTQVGGDFYDVVPLANDEIALVIGDVEGHDMTAATVMGQLRSALRAYLMLNRDPGVVLSLLNEFSIRSESKRLATAAVAVLNSKSGELLLSSAGHPTPLAADERGGAAAGVLLETGPPLGVHRHTYVPTRTVLQSGSRLVFYTDGLIDVGRPGADEQFSRLARSVGSPLLGCDDLADAILADHIDAEGSPDDIALLVVEWKVASA